MRKKLNTTEAAVSKTHRRKTLWQNFVRTMAMVVIFCTTYALILPAITMEPDLICTLAEHTHTEGCWETSLEKELVCTVSDVETETHQHEEACWTQLELYHRGSGNRDPSAWRDLLGRGNPGLHHR